MKRALIYIAIAGTIIGMLSTHGPWVALWALCFGAVIGFAFLSGMRPSPAISVANDPEVSPTKDYLPGAIPDGSVSDYSGGHGDGGHHV